jgi:hypothetical protein
VPTATACFGGSGVADASDAVITTVSNARTTASLSLTLLS